MEPIKFTEVQADGRVRLEMGDIDGLAESICLYGLIHPIAIDQNKTLVAGGRRYDALCKIRNREVEEWWNEDVKTFHETDYLTFGTLYTFKPTIAIDHLGEMELEENIRRKNMSWQEICLGVVRVHEHKVKRAALNSDKWTNQMTADLLDVSKGKFQYTLHIGKLLRDEDHPLWECESMTTAIQKLSAEELEKQNAELAKRSVANVQKKSSEILAQLQGKDPSSFSEDDDEFFTGGVIGGPDLASEFAAFTGGAGLGGDPNDEAAGPTTATVIPLAEMLGRGGTQFPAADVYFINVKEADDAMLARRGKEWTIYYGVTADRLEEFADADNIPPLIYIKTEKCENKNPARHPTVNYELIFAVPTSVGVSLAVPTGTSYYMGSAEFERALYGNGPDTYPIGLFEWLLKTFAKKGQAVFNPIVGTGCFCKACVNVGQAFTAWEASSERYAKAYYNTMQAYKQVLPNAVIEPLH